MASTPYLDEVHRCERVAFLDQGKLRGIGTPDEILTRFADIFNPPGIDHAQGCEVKDENVIEVEHLVKAFGSFHAVDDISFTVKRGEIFGFLGANEAEACAQGRELQCGTGLRLRVYRAERCRQDYSDAHAHGLEPADKRNWPCGGL